MITSNCAGCGQPLLEQVTRNDDGKFYHRICEPVYADPFPVKRATRESLKMLTDKDMVFNTIIKKIVDLGFRNVHGQIVTYRWNEVDGVGRIGITAGDWLVVEGPSITPDCLVILKGAYIVRFKENLLDRAAKAAHEAALCGQSSWNDIDESCKNYWRRAAKAALQADTEASMFRRRSQRRYI